jgi:DNA-binding CsgD family transcriptional regulator
VHARLPALAASVKEPVPAAFAQAAAALAGSDAEQLEHAAVAFADLGLRLHAAEAMVTASALYRQAGRPSRAAAAAERAAELVRHCPDARTPLLNHEALRSPLTRREREIATLAAAGRSSKQIAQHLGLSARTVDNHLGRAYHKLGVRSRAELHIKKEGIRTDLDQIPS